MKTLLAAAAITLLATPAAYAASCNGSLTGNCVVIDSDGDFASEGTPNPLVNFGPNTQLGINEIFTFFQGQIGVFTTTGDFDVDGGTPNPVTAKVTISKGDAGQFDALDLAFNSGASQSIVAGGTFFFDLISGALNSFSITGDASPVFAGPISYTVALSTVPIPAALPLFGTAIAGMAVLRYRRRRTTA